MLEISSQNITEKTGELLNNSSLRGFITVYNKENYGWFIYNFYEKENKNVIPEDLLRIMDYAASLNCSWIMLDCDIEPNQKLPIYKW